MSQLAVSGRTVRSPRAGNVRAPRAAQPGRTRLTSATGARRVEAVTGAQRSSAGFVTLIGAIALFGVVALLILNTMRAEQSFTVSRLQGDVTTLQQRQQQLDSDLSTVRSPENLAVKADSLGMVKASSVKYVRASDHKTLGVAKVNGAGQPLNVETLPDTPASKVAAQMLSGGTIGTHIVDPSAAKAPGAAKNASKKASTGKPAKGAPATH